MTNTLHIIYKNINNSTLSVQHRLIFDRIFLFRDRGRATAMHQKYNSNNSLWCTQQFRAPRKPHHFVILIREKNKDLCFSRFSISDILRVGITENNASHEWLQLWNDSWMFNCSVCILVGNWWAHILRGTMNFTVERRRSWTKMTKRRKKTCTIVIRTV